eukprot:2681561-Heterocapsa_arctica.AAC.1
MDLARLHDKGGPMRGIDYIIARAAVDSRTEPHSPYGRFLANSLQACRPDMVRQLAYVLGLSILQTLQKSKNNSGDSAAGSWLTSTLAEDVECDYAVATDPTFGSVVVVR